LIDKAQAEIALLDEGLRAQIRTRGNRHVDTAHMRYSLGMALWLSASPEKQPRLRANFKRPSCCEPTHDSLIAFEKARDLAQESLTLFQEPGARTAWPYWRPPTFRREDRRAMTDLFMELLAMARREREATITASTMQQGLRRHVHGPHSRPNSPVHIHKNNLRQNRENETTRTQIRSNMPTTNIPDHRN